MTVFPDKNLSGLVCTEPFRTVNIDPVGNVQLCGCSDWMPQIAGNINNASLQDILNSPKAQLMRESIRDGSYRYCNADKCGVINNKWLIPHTDAPGHNLDPEWRLYRKESSKKIPTKYFIAGDKTCNLSCPSCRNTVIKNTIGDTGNNIRVMNLLNQNVFAGKSHLPIEIMLSTSGEIFASKFLLEFLQTFPINNYPNVIFHLQTNGLLLKKNWHLLANIHKNIKSITVTTDGCTADTYEHLRRGGRFTDILDNLKYMQQLKQQHNFVTHNRMVVQLANYQQITDFYHWSKQLGFDTVEYSRLQDWKTYTGPEFAELDVLNPEHQAYNAATDSIKELLSEGSSVVLLGFSI
jgi:MoaA/NifB/PqqE/SkfB family radical SAM enzyme